VALLWSFLLRYPWLTVFALVVPVLALGIGGTVLALAALAVSPFCGDHRRRVAVLGGLALTVGLLFLVRDPHADPPPLPAGTTGGRGVVSVEAPLNAWGEARFSLRLEAVEVRGHWQTVDATVVVRGFPGASPPTGQRWAWSGRLEEGTLRWTGGTPLGWDHPLSQVRADARTQLFASLDRLDEPSAALARALVLGNVDDLTPAERRAFRDSGCSHVLALSGMHLSLLAVLLTVALQRLAPGTAVFVLIQVALGAFCFLAGPIPSLYRAWSMAFLAGVAQWRKARVDAVELLAQSFLVTVVFWPAMAFTLSLQLSFLSLTGLFLLSWRLETPLRPLLGRWAASTLGSSLAALSTTLPLTLALFGDFHAIGILLSAPLVFLTTVYLALSVLLLGLAPWWASELPLAVILGFRAVYDATFALAGWGAGLPAFPAAAVVLAALATVLARAAVFLYNKAHRGSRMPVSLHYDSPADLQAFLDERGFNALKRWGQNFLINPGARRQILAALNLTPGEPVWEIGPGLGALTHHLVQDGHPLTVFEIDPGYAAFLRDEFKDAPGGFILWEGDVIKTWRGARQAGVKCVGNLPYNAASAIIADFIEGGFFPEVFVVTVQKEMADRMTAVVGTKNYSSFSVLCQSVFALSDVMVLRPGSFYPAPEVTSRVVSLTPHHKWPALDHKRFSVFVRECFSSRRKTLRNNLPGAAAALRLSDDALKNAFLSQGIDLSRRAETLAVEDFIRVYEAT